MCLLQIPYNFSTSLISRENYVCISHANLYLYLYKYDLKKQKISHTFVLFNFSKKIPIDAQFSKFSTINAQTLSVTSQLPKTTQQVYGRGSS